MMATALVTTPRFFATPAKWRAWLEPHHAQAAELWVGFYKTSSGKPSITWPESVDQALCFGWIDGKRQSIDGESYKIRFTPRKATSIWSAVNVAKVKELEQLGLMRPAGMAAFRLRTEARTGVYAFERNEAAVLRPEDEAKLRANAKAWKFFGAQAPWYQRTCRHWIVSAKREQTRAKRLAQLVADSEAGRTIGPLTRPTKG